MKEGSLVRLISRLPLSQRATNKQLQTNNYKQLQTEIKSQKLYGMSCAVLTLRGPGRKKVKRWRWQRLRERVRETPFEQNKTKQNRTKQNTAEAFASLLFLCSSSCSNRIERVRSLLVCCLFLLSPVAVRCFCFCLFVCFHTSKMINCVTAANAFKRKCSNEPESARDRSIGQRNGDLRLRVARASVTYVHSSARLVLRFPGLEGMRESWETRNRSRMRKRTTRTDSFCIENTKYILFTCIRTPQRMIFKNSLF